MWCSTFSQLSDAPLFVSDIIHKTKIIVNEEGSEAAAATGASLEVRGGLRFKKINVDSTFIFSIYDTEKKISLFIGKIDNPSGADDQDAPEDSSYFPVDQVSDISFNSRESDPDNDDSKETDNKCPGENFETCVKEVCVFRNTRTQRICIEDCEEKCM